MPATDAAIDLPAHGVDARERHRHALAELALGETFTVAEADSNRPDAVRLVRITGADAGARIEHHRVGNPLSERIGVVLVLGGGRADYFGSDEAGGVVANGAGDEPAEDRALVVGVLFEGTAQAGIFTARERLRERQEAYTRPERRAVVGHARLAVRGEPQLALRAERDWLLVLRISRESVAAGKLLQSVMVQRDGIAGF